MKILKLFPLLALLVGCATNPYVQGFAPVTESQPPSRIVEWFADGASYDPFLDDFLPLLQGDQLTLVYFDPEADRVAFQSTINDNSKEDWLRPYGDTGLFWKTITIDPQVPFVYKYRVTMKDGTLTMQKDPFNLASPEISEHLSWFEVKDQGGLLIALDRLEHEAENPVRSRNIWVYLPKEYKENPQENFPVMYFMDGQNLWDHPELPYGGWKLDTTLDKMVADGEIPPMILVGIPSSSKRKEEFMGVTTHYGEINEENRERAEEWSQIALSYQDYLINTIKPYIDGEFRTLPGKESTFIGGSSFGAGVSIITAFTYPDVFSRIAAFSFGQYDRENEPLNYEQKPFNIYNWVLDHSPEPGTFDRIYIQCGTESIDATFSIYAQKVVDHLRGKGYSESQLFWYLDEGAEHNEAAWALIAPQAMQYLLGPNS